MNEYNINNTALRALLQAYIHGNTINNKLQNKRYNDRYNRRHYCTDTYSIWLSTPLPTIEVVLAAFVGKIPAEYLLDSSSCFKQSHILGRSALGVRALCWNQKHFYCMIVATRETCRNTLLIDSDSRGFVSQIDLLSLSILLCLLVCSTCDVIHKMEATIKMQILASTLCQVILMVH